MATLTKKAKVQHVTGPVVAMVRVVSSVFHLASASADAHALVLVSAFVLTHVAKSCLKICIHSNDEDFNREARGQCGKLAFRQCSRSFSRSALSNAPDKTLPQYQIQIKTNRIINYFECWDTHHLGTPPSIHKLWATR